MKKSILLKIVLTFVMLTLILSLVACNKPVTDDPIVKTPDEVTAMDQLVGIIKGADGLIKALSNVKADGNLTADVDIAVNQKAGDTVNDFVLGIKGNLNQTSPELLVNFSDKKVEKLALGYKASKLYLKQPLTSLNKNADGTAAAASDAMVADVTALKPTIDDAMFILMDTLAGIDLKLDLDALGDSIGELLGSEFDLSTLIVFKELTVAKDGRDGNRLEITNDTIDLLKSLVLNKLLKGSVGEVIDTVVNELFKTTLGVEYLLGSNIYVEAYKDSNNTINGIKLGFTAKDSSTGDILIDLKKFNNASDKKAAIAFGTEYTAKNLDLGLSLALPQNGISANLGAIIAPNFASDGNILASGSLDFVRDGETYEVPAYFNGTVAYFNTAGIYSAINGTASTDIIVAPENTLYSASVYKKTAEGNVSQSLVALINSAVSDAKTNYVAKKDEKEATPEAKDDTPSKGLINSIYELLGGKLTTTTKDNVTTYNKTSEDAMLKQIDVLVGEYTRFVIYKKGDVESYEKAIKNITTLFENNEDWIIGTETSQATGDYGILNWDKDLWKGGAVLYKEGPKNDLLDLANVFLCNGKTDGTPNDVTTEDVADFLNYYVGLLSYYSTDDTTFKDNIDDANKTLLIAKNVFLKSDQTADDKDVLKLAKDAHKEATDKAIFGDGLDKDYTIPNNLVRQLLGVESTEANVLKSIIDGGLYVGVSCNKGEGLNGKLVLSDDKVGTTEYLTLSAKVGLTATAPDANITDVTDAIEIAKDVVPVTKNDTGLNLEKYKIISKWEDGTKKCDEDGKYIYEMDGEDFVYSNRNENAEALIDELVEIYQAYLVMGGEIG